MRFNWTEDAISELRLLWAVGETSSTCAEALASKFGGILTRQAVLGKTHRLGLLARIENIIPTWTDEVVAELRRLHAAEYNLKETAESLSTKFDRDISYKAVARKMERLGLPRVKKKKQAQQVTQLPKLPRRKPDVQEIIDEQIPLEQRKTLFELTNKTCRWPVGNPGEPGFFFCGKEEANLSKRRPYCQFHEWRACRESEPIEVAVA